MPRILDGIAIGRQIREEVAQRVAQLKSSGRQPGLATVLVGEDPASALYVRSKVQACTELGIYSRKLELPASTTTGDLLQQVQELNRDDAIDGILVQTPLPSHVDSRAILHAVDPRKDVDGFHPENVGRLCANLPGLRPCTPAGIMEMLRREKIDPRGKEAVVVGRSDIVGKPMALLLLHEHATVTICHSRTADLRAVCRRADILVAAIGKAGLVRADFVKPGAVLIDVGMNRVTDAALAEEFFAGSPRLETFRTKGAVLMGDMAPQAFAESSAYTPVPGGVGPLTIAMLMSNTAQAAAARRA